MKAANSSVEKCRIDKWLFAARFFKTRALAADAIERGRVTLSDNRVKPAKVVVIGDMLEIRIGNYQYVIKVLALSNQRGSATQAQQWYSETDESCRQREIVAAKMKAQPVPVYLKGRPTKRDRREIERFRSQQDAF